MYSLFFVFLLLLRQMLVSTMFIIILEKKFISTTFTGTLSSPVVYASKHLIILHIWSTVTALMFSSAVGRNSFLILIILG